jgi:hypothetical protein
MGVWFPHSGYTGLQGFAACSSAGGARLPAFVPSLSAVSLTNSWRDMML